MCYNARVPPNTLSKSSAQQITAAPEKKSLLEFPSLGFGADRRVLRVGEFAERVCCTDQHVIDLLEEGKLAGVDISGRFEYLNIPAAAVDALAARCKLPREVILETIRATKPARRMTRSHWRIPIKEGFERFLAENHSMA
jgi:hypothetical protein